MAASVMMWIACLVIATEASQVYGQTNCEWGRYGEQCEKACPEHCTVNEARKLQHCHKLTGKCSEGCMRGWHGDMCDLPCNSHCQKNTCNQQNSLCSFGCGGTYSGDFCNITTATPCKETNHCSDCDRESGDCVTECDTGYYDRHCKSTCSKNCRKNTCVTSSHGSANCTDGCVPGYQGLGCNIPCDSPGGNCTTCPGGCDGGYCQLGSFCMSGCVDSYYGTGCDGAAVELAAGVSGAAISFLVIVFLVVCCKYCQRFRQKNVTQTEDVVCDSVDEIGGEPVVELEWYSETPLKDMATPCGSPDGNCGSGGAAGGGADDVYDVADVGRRELAAVFDNIYSKISRA